MKNAYIVSDVVVLVTLKSFPVIVHVKASVNDFPVSGQPN